MCRISIRGDTIARGDAIGYRPIAIAIDHLAERRVHALRE